MRTYRAILRKICKLICSLEKLEQKTTQLLLNNQIMNILCSMKTECEGEIKYMIMKLLENLVIKLCKTSKILQIEEFTSDCECIDLALDNKK